MTRNDTPDKLEWSICPLSGTDLAQQDWVIRDVIWIFLLFVETLVRPCLIELLHFQSVTY